MPTPPSLLAAERSARAPLGRARALAALAVLALVHLLGCLYYFPLREVASGEPAMTSDYAVQYL